MIAFGSNLPRRERPPEEVVAAALALLEQPGSIDILSVSRLFHSAAVPAGAGPDFVNGAVELESDLAPQALLERLHAVEAALGRRRGRRWAARTIDLDLLAAGGAVLPDAATERHWRTLSPAEAAQTAPETLVLPHPRLAERAFALVPLAEVAPDWRHPALRRTVREMLAALDPAERAAVTPLPAAPWLLAEAALGAAGRRSTTRHEVGGGAVGPLHALQVVRWPGSRGVELHYLDAHGDKVTDTWHKRLADALAQAHTEFGLDRGDWRSSGETLEKPAR